MSDLTAPTLPSIDISPFLSSSSTPFSLQTCALHLAAACKSPGFFYLTNHNLPSSLTTSVLSLARDFFTNATPEQKKRIRRRGTEEGGDGARGYQVVGENVTGGKRDWHEAVDWYRPVVASEPSLDSPRADGAKPSHGHVNGGTQDSKGEGERKAPYELLHGVNLWPEYPAGFRGTYEEYVAKMLELGTAVVRAMGWAAGLDDKEFFVKKTRSSFWVMRAIGYPPLPHSKPHATDGHADESGNAAESVDGVSCGAHTDYGCVTLLLADDTKGALQVWHEEVNEWVDADPVEGALVVNIGDMMERWMGGRWKSTRHKVVHRGGGMRVSVPFFFEPDWEAGVGSLWGGEEGEVRYGDHLRGKVGGNFG